MGRQLEMTPYLQGLKDLFDKYGVTKAYTFGRFMGEKEDGTLLFADTPTQVDANIITDYIDNYTEDESKAYPEMRSICLSGNADAAYRGAACIYVDGVFYTNKE